MFQMYVHQILPWKKKYIKQPVEYIFTVKLQLARKTLYTCCAEMMSTWKLRVQESKFNTTRQKLTHEQEPFCAQMWRRLF